MFCRNLSWGSRGNICFRNLALESLKPAEIAVAAPVATKEACTALEKRADRLVCLETRDPFIAVGQWYRDFAQTTDEEVLKFLKKAKKI